MESHGGAQHLTSHLDIEAVLGRLIERRGLRSYEDQGEIARGGQGMVRCIWDAELSRQLAMKISLEPAPHPEDSAASSRSLRRFLEEAKVTARLDHPGIVPVHELGMDQGGRLYFTMKLVKGRDQRDDPKQGTWPRVPGSCALERAGLVVGGLLLHS
jgi:serine/threonine protein kinase